VNCAASKYRLTNDNYARGVITNLTNALHHLYVFCHTRTTNAYIVLLLDSDLDMEAPAVLHMLV